jgi:predicted transglutaminase-like cysteine proteinase
MKGIFRSALLGTALMVLTAPAPAFAGVGIPGIPAALLFAIHAPEPAPCRVPSPDGDSVQAAKAEALLGGAPSALAMILRQQEGAVSPAAAPTVSETCQPTPDETVVAQAPPSTVLPTSTSLPGEFLGSQRLAVSRTMFDTDWERVSRRSVTARQMKGLGLVAGDGEANLRAINTWVNGNVRYVEDRALYGRADYWATSRETLRRRAGDCEDLAILKYQMLAAIGIPREAMFLTIARDLARHADHAVLIVREGARFWLLDNSTDQLVDAATPQDYRPIFSYGTAGKWLHGYGTLARATPDPVPVPAPAPLLAINVR